MGLHRSAKARGPAHAVPGGGEEPAGLELVTTRTRPSRSTRRCSGFLGPASGTGSPLASAAGAGPKVPCSAKAATLAGEDGIASVSTAGSGHPSLPRAGAARGQLLIGLGDLAGGPFESVASAVSDDGSVVVGESIGSISQYEIGRSAVRWTLAGDVVTGMASLGWLAPSSHESHAYAVSSDGGIVAGTSTDPADSLAFRWTQADGMRRIEDLAGGMVRSSGLGVSDAGRVVGECYDAGGAKACFADEEQFATLADPFSAPITGSAEAITPDGVFVAGTRDTQEGREAFRWSATDLARGEGAITELGDLEGGAFASTAHAISDDGSTVVGSSEVGGGTEAFRWTEAGGIVSLGDLPGGSVNAVATAASADGSLIVGRANDASGSRAFAWDAAHGMRHLTDLLDDRGVETTGWRSGGTAPRHQDR